MDFDSAADEVYAVVPGEFTALRNSLSKQAADDGDADLAKELRGLAKPSLAAWATNNLVRNHRTEIDALLKLGESLRVATEQLHGDQLSALSKQQRQVIGALVQQAVADAGDVGQRVSASVARAVEQTLRAALGDPARGDQLAAARLVEPLDYVGFPGAVRAAEPKARAKGAGGSDEKDSAAEAARAEARADLSAAKRSLAAATDALAGADRKVELVSGHLDEVRRRAKELTGQLRDAERVQRAATKERDQRQDLVDAAEQRITKLG